MGRGEKKTRGVLRTAFKFFVVVVCLFIFFFRFFAVVVFCLFVAFVF